MPSAPPIAPNAGGNLAPTAPFLAAPAAAGDLYPGTPAAIVSARAAVAAGAVLYDPQNAVIGNAIVIGALTYSFVATPVAAYQVAAGLTSELVAAINGTDGRTPPNPLFSADGENDELTLTARIPGSAGNGVALGYTGAVSGVAWSASATTGGSDAYPVSGTPGAIA